MKIVLLGAGEAFDETLGNTCALVSNESTVLLDCGYAAPFQVWRYDASPELLDAIYISHAHADHYFGIPPLLVRMWEDGRTKPLTMISQKQVIEQIWQILDLGYPNMRSRFQFPVRTIVASTGAEIPYREFRMRFAPGRHSVPNLAIRIESGGKAFCYSGDGTFTDEGRELYSGAGLLLHETWKFEPSSVHGDIPSVIAMAEEIGVKHLILTHIQRSVRKHDARLQDLRSNVRLTLATPGAVFES